MAAADKKWWRKLRDRVERAAAGTLQPDETIEHVVQGQVRPRMWLGLELVIGSWAFFFIKYYAIALTQGRVLVVRGSRLTGRPKRIEWVEGRDGVLVDHFRPGILITKLFLRRRTGEGSILRFRTGRRFRDEAEQIAQTLPRATG